jgi:hypothetical protein
MTTIASAKASFFDRAAVMSRMDAATRKALNKSGARLRLIAQRSMRYVNESTNPDKPRRVSSPGHPPLAVRQHPFIRKFMFYSYDEASQSVVVGPAGFSGGTANPAPGILEHGGPAKIRNRRRMRRLVGGPGEIAIGLAGGRSTKLAYNTLLGTAPVTYVRLTTPAQAKRSNRLNELLYGPAMKRVNVAARPFMAPALMIESKQMAALWANSL